MIKRHAISSLAVFSALCLTGCGESLTSVQSVDLAAKPNAVAGPAAGGETNSAFVTTGAGDSAKASARAKVPAEGVVKSAATTEAAKSADQFIAVATPGNTAYKIGPDDLLEVSVFKVPELSRQAQVADGGTINLPLVGEIQAAGKTARDLEIELTKKLGDKYLRSPQVTVIVKEYNSQRVTVEGAVKKPGVYPIRSKNSLLQMLANAGGMEELADQTEVLVVRQTEGKRYAGRFDIDAIRKGSVQDPALQAGDVVIVQTSDTKAAFQNFLKVIPVAHVLTLL